MLRPPQHIELFEVPVGMPTTRKYEVAREKGAALYEQVLNVVISHSIDSGASGHQKFESGLVLPQCVLSRSLRELATLRYGMKYIKKR